jgi:hypothetical protein
MHGSACPGLSFGATRGIGVSRGAAESGFLVASLLGMTIRIKNIVGHTGVADDELGQSRDGCCS